MGTIKTTATSKRITWVVLAAALVGVGVVLDGATEAGHHLALIAAGVVIGWGAAKERG
jgi:hypothetical protein